MTKEFEVEFCASDRKTGKFLGLFLVTVLANNQRDAIDLSLSRTEVLFHSNVKLECNGVTEL